MTIRDRLERHLAAILEGRTPGSSSLRDDTPLGEAGLGLDSLDLADLVSRLEDDLGVDPFAHAAPELRSVGDLVRVYEGLVAAE